MKDIKGFCKLMDINIPNYEYFDYYIDQLSKTNRWKDIRNMIDLYEKSEDIYGDLYELRYKKSNEIIDYLKTTRAYNDLIYDNLLPDYPVTKNFEYNENKKYISIDINKANWVALKRYDPDFENSLGNSYEEFISKFDVPEIFNHSKQLRQYIFGNINPKRQGKVQRTIIQNLLDEFSYLNLEISCIKNDEVIYSFDNFDQISDLLNNIDKKLFKIKLFIVKRIEDFRINTYLSESGEKLYSEMVGSNGNLFFLNLKKYILNEPIDIRDLFFRMDGNLAIWYMDGLKITM